MTCLQQPDSPGCTETYLKPSDPETPDGPEQPALKADKSTVKFGSGQKTKARPGAIFWGAGPGPWR